MVGLNVLAVANIPQANHRGQPFHSFLSSSATIAALVFLFGVALFPNLIVSTLDPAYSLTVVSAASSQKTLGIMRNIALIGMPFVLAYTAIIYWAFRGKVNVGDLGY